MYSTWVIKSSKLNGEVLLFYLNGHLTGIEVLLQTPLTSVQFTFFKKHLHYQEKDMLNCEVCMRHKQLITVMATNIKIKMFCDYYFKYREVKYKITASETGKIKTVEVNEELLITYFTSNNFLFKQKWSVANYVKYYNELRNDTYGAKLPQFPNAYNKQFANKLTTPELNQYYAHLRSLGLVAKKDAVGNLIDFIKSTTQTIEPTGCVTGQTNKIGDLIDSVPPSPTNTDANQ